MNCEALKFGKLPAQGTGQCELVIADRRNSTLAQKAEGRIKADEPGCVVVTRLESIGHDVRLNVELAARTRAALTNRFQLRFAAGGNPQQPGAERSQKPFVSGAGEKVRLKIAELKRKMSRALRRVHCKKNSGIARDFADFCDRLDDACHVGNVLNDDQSRFRPERGADLCGLDSTDFVNVDCCHADTARSFELPQRTQHRVVFRDRRHHVIAVPQRSMQDRVQAVRAVERENDLVLRGGSQQFRCAVAAALDNLLKLQRGICRTSPDGAVEAGYLDSIVGAEQLLPEACAEAKRLAQLPAHAYAKTKAVMRSATIRLIRETLEGDLSLAGT